MPSDYIIEGDYCYCSLSINKADIEDIKYVFKHYPIKGILFGMSKKIYILNKDGELERK